MDAVQSINICLTQFIKDKVKFISNGQVVSVDELNSIDLNDLYLEFYDEKLIYQDCLNEIIRFTLEELSLFKKTIMLKMSDIIAREYYCAKINTLTNVDNCTTKDYLKDYIYDYYDSNLKHKMNNTKIYFSYKSHKSKTKFLKK